MWEQNYDLAPIRSSKTKIVTHEKSSKVEAKNLIQNVLLEVLLKCSTYRCSQWIYFRLYWGLKRWCQWRPNDAPDMSQALDKGHQHGGPQTLHLRSCLLRKFYPSDEAPRIGTLPGDALVDRDLSRWRPLRKEIRVPILTLSSIASIPKLSGEFQSWVIFILHTFAIDWILEYKSYSKYSNHQLLGYRADGEIVAVEQIKKCRRYLLPSIINATCGSRQEP